MTRRAPWYQQQPYPAVVEHLLDAELLAEGGTASLKVAARLVEAHDRVDRDEADAVGAQLHTELDRGHLVPGPVDPRRLDVAAQDIVDLLVAHRAPGGGQ